MLEYSSLHVDDWTQRTLTNAGSAWTRRICDPACHQVGFVRLDGEPALFWFSWLRRVRLEVYETEDASHLMTLIRSWGMIKIWDVYDAEEQRIGSIAPPSLRDSLGEQRAFLDMQPYKQGHILDPVGNILASFQHKTSSPLAVTFATEIPINPFLRMLLLGGILTLDPLPR